jgi:glycosyltransferase involved in cell wall biosynthesis
MRVLMVSTEYPPMNGGVGRYTANLVSALRRIGIEVYVVCNDEGKGDINGISPKNSQNSEVLFQTVDEIHPDLVHIQYEPGMYGLLIDPKNPRNSGTYIDSFYKKSNVPIVTTFHTAYNLKQWMSQANLIKKSGKTKQLGIPLRFLIRFWKYSLNYKAFQNLNKEKLAMSKAGIVFSHYMRNLIGGGTIIYHGADSHTPTIPDKKDARAFFSLPSDKRIALALGFKTESKGWDILNKIKIPEGWKIVINSSKSHYNKENYDITNMIRNNPNIIDIQKGYLNDKELSMLFYSSDVVLLPYKVTAASGVMFDSLAHGVPFISSDLGFFKEFSDQGLGITSKRTGDGFSNAIKKLDKDYDKYASKANDFKKMLSWDSVAKKHQTLYADAVS